MLIVFFISTIDFNRVFLLRFYRYTESQNTKMDKETAYQGKILEYNSFLEQFQRELVRKIETFFLILSLGEN